MGILNTVPQSWGRYPKVKPQRVVPIFWRDNLPDLAAYEQSVLPYGYGRSYGDSCLNEGGISLDMSHLRRFISFDDQMGILRCEAGVSLAEILDLIVPRGWFLPVTPGTKFVSVGGAIANDVHGKNHYKAGTFGCYVKSFELLRSNGERLLCTPENNSELFRATIGGLGLTGVILWAEFRLKPISNPYIAVENIRYSSLKEFQALADASDQSFEYTVAWVDCLAKGRAMGRGIFMRGNHDRSQQERKTQTHHRPLLSVPFDLPPFVLDTWSIRLGNMGLYYKQFKKRVQKVVHYDSYFYPLDAIQNWNRLYGKRGLFQYQCIVPYEQGYETIAELLGRIASSGEGSFLTVFKKCGTIRSPGMLSFPRPGLLLALDFPNNGTHTRRLFESLDHITRASGGIMYPAKDALMSAEDFQAFYPQWREFEQYIDSKFSSSFWRRVTTSVSAPSATAVEE